MPGACAHVDVTSGESRAIVFEFHESYFEKLGLTGIAGELKPIVGLVNSSWAKMAAPKSDPPRNWTTRATPLHDRCAEDVDRLLEDQFDSHLSPLRTGMSSRSFRLRGVRIGDGDRRLAG